MNIGYNQFCLKFNHTCLNSLSAFFLLSFSSGVSSFGLIDNIERADITDLEPDFGVSLESKDFNA